jgi:hypothetical protein
VDHSLRQRTDCFRSGLLPVRSVTYLEPRNARTSRLTTHCLGKAVHARATPSPSSPLIYYHPSPMECSPTVPTTSTSVSTSHSTPLHDHKRKTQYTPKSTSSFHRLLIQSCAKSIRTRSLGQSGQYFHPRLYEAVKLAVRVQI